MKLNKNYIFIGISSLALIVVLIIQVNWIHQTAKIKEDLFNETAKIILSRTAEAISSDSAACRSIQTSTDNEGTRKVDSLFNHYMALYNIHIDYYFEVHRYLKLEQKKSSAGEENPISGLSPYTPNAYATCIAPNDIPGNQISSGPLELKLIFPDREQFLMEEMGIPFITSVLLILVVIFMFWRTTLSLIKEKEISEHTTDFLNNMTHEFKTPLTNIGLASKMLVKETNIKQEDKVRHYSGIILEENEKLRQQVEQVLSMTALERGEVPIQKTETDLHQVIRDSLKCMSVQIENLKGHMDLQLDAEQVVVLGDRSHLTNSVCNLLDNAIKYSDGSPELMIRTYNRETYLVLEIADKGIGIEEEYQKKIFEKFFRVPTGDVHDVKGFGLGLTYIKKIIEMHGGFISLTSRKSEGTTVVINIPYA